HRAVGDHVGHRRIGHGRRLRPARRGGDRDRFPPRGPRGEGRPRRGRRRRLRLTRRPDTAPRTPGAPACIPRTPPRNAPPTPLQWDPDSPRKDPPVSTSFERVSRFSVGNDLRAVDDSLPRAGTAYEGRSPSFSGAAISAASVATARGGNYMRVVDEALHRLSDAFAPPARDDAVAEHGEEAWIAQLTERADVLKERLERPAGDRFAPAAQGEPAYDKADVDGLCDQLVAYFTDGHPMSVDDVRRAAFGRRRGPDGYREAVVDVYLDHVADVMASVP